VAQICETLTDSLLAIAETLGRMSRDRIECARQAAGRRKRDPEEMATTEDFQVTINAVSSTSGSLSAGYIVAIVVGALAGVLLLVVVVFIAYRMWQPSNEIRYEGV
jgi:hypothetical protein